MPDAQPRRAHPSLTGVVVGAAAAAEVALFGWWSTARVLVVLVLGQLLVVASLTVWLVVARYRRARREYEVALAESAREAVRAELAEELHDELGHHLSLIAMRASVLQMSSCGETAPQAAGVRAQVEQALLHLRQTVELLRAPGEAAPVFEKAAAPEIVERARRSGADIRFDDRLGDALPAPVRLTAVRAVQEGLTNALKHAPGQPVIVRQWDDGVGVVHVEVESGGDADEDRSVWSGLAALEQRVQVLGGTLATSSSSGRRTLHVEVPSASSSPPPRPVPVTVRRPLAATVRGAAIPLVAVAVSLAAFHAWSTHDTVLEVEAFAQVEVGRSWPEARLLLPRRQAPVRLIPAPPRPPGWQCAYFSDGNFPLGTATYEICTDGEVVTRTTDLRSIPWW